MDTSLELIQGKIAELEAKLVNAKIAERELHALEKTAARQTKAAQTKSAVKVAKPREAIKAPKASKGEEAAALAEAESAPMVCERPGETRCLTHSQASRTALRKVEPSLQIVVSEFHGHEKTLPENLRAFSR